MKKLLALLSTISITAASSSTIISCSINTNFDWVAPTPEDPNDNNGQGSQLNYISIETIKKATAHIWNLSSVTEVNKELKKVTIDGVQNLYAILNYGSQTDVLVTITLEDNWRVTEDVYEFEIPGAILAESLEIIEINTIKAATEGISGLKNLEEVNAELAKIALTGVKSLTATLVSGSDTDVLVSISLQSGYVLDVSQPNYQIIGAIKEKMILKTSDIKAATENIVSKNNLAEVQAALDEIQMTGLISLTGSVSSIATDVLVTIKIDSEIAKLEGSTTFTITNALKIVVKTTDVKKATNSIMYLNDLEAVQSRLDQINIAGVEKLTASLVSGSKTDVTITITISDNAILEGESSYKIMFAIAIVVETSQVSSLANNLGVANTLAEFQTKLNSVYVSGLESLTAEMEEGSLTNVLVKIKVNSMARLVGADTFIVQNAVKVEIDTDFIIEVASKITNQPSLEAYREKINSYEFVGVNNFFVSFIEGSLTDVLVTINPGKNGIIKDSASFTFKNVINRVAEPGLEGTKVYLEQLLRDSVFHYESTWNTMIGVDKLRIWIEANDTTGRFSWENFAPKGEEYIYVQGMGLENAVSPNRGWVYRLSYQVPVMKDGKLAWSGITEVFSIEANY